MYLHVVFKYFFVPRQIQVSIYIYIFILVIIYSMMIWFFQKRTEKETEKNRLDKLERRILAIESEILSVVTDHATLREKVLRRLRVKEYTPPTEEEETKDPYKGILLPDK